MTSPQTKRLVLVTGAFGFIGSNLVREFASRGDEVVGLGRPSISPRKTYLSESLECDLTLENLQAWGKAPDVVVHCAGGSSVAHSIINPHDDFRRSVDTAASILEYVRQRAPSASLVIPSSASIYGHVSSQPISIANPARPASPYGLHKLIVEQLCQLYSKQFGIKSSIVRLFSVYGIGLRKQLLWDACRKLKSGDVHFQGTGDETRDWLHISDAANLLASAADYASAECPIVNGGSGTSISIRQVVALIAQELGLSIAPQFGAPARAGDPMHYQADISDAKAWGWHPTRDFRVEVGRYAEWFEGGAKDL